MVYVDPAILLKTNFHCLTLGSAVSTAKAASMKIEKRLLHSQFQDWLNLQVARHLEAQATRFRAPSSTDQAETIQIKANSSDADMVHA